MNLTSGRDMYRANPAREIEQIAIRTVAAWLGDRGAVSDHSATGEPDLWIEYCDGRQAVGEVTWHEDEQIQEMWKAVFKQPDHQIVTLDAGQGQWSLRTVHGAHIGKLYRDLPAFITALNDDNRTRVDPEYLHPNDPVRVMATRLGISSIAKASDDEPPRAIFFLPSSGGAIPTDPNVVVDWVEQVIADPAYQDVTAKLLAVSDVDERHVFIMSGTQTEFGANERLARISEAAPDRAPTVPKGITHVWVVSRWTDPSLGSHAGLWIEGLGWSVVVVPDLLG